MRVKATVRVIGYTGRQKFHMICLLTCGEVIVGKLEYNNKNAFCLVNRLGVNGTSMLLYRQRFMFDKNNCGVIT